MRLPRSYVLAAVALAVGVGPYGCSERAPVGVQSSAFDASDAEAQRDAGEVPDAVDAEPVPSAPLDVTLDHPVFAARPLDRVELFGPLDARCTSAGGTLEDEMCRCPDGTGFVTDITAGALSATLGASRCASPRVVKRARASYASVLSASGPAALAQALPVLGVEVKFGGDEATVARLAADTATWADGAGLADAGAPFAYAEPPRFGLADTPRFAMDPRVNESLTVTLGVPSPDVLRTMVGDVLDGLQYAYDQYMTADTKPYYYRNRVGIVEPDPKALGATLGLPRFERQPPPFAGVTADLAAADLGAHARAARAAYELARTGKLPFSRGVRLFGESCMDACRVISEATPLEAASAVTARRERIYVYGRVAREVVWLEEHGALRGFVLFSPSGSVGLVGLVSDHITTERVTRTVAAFDRLWNPLGTVIEERAVYAVDMEGIPRTTDRMDAGGATVVSPRALLALCEADGDIASFLLDPVIRPRLVRGPHTTDTNAAAEVASGSMLGFFPAARDAIGDYFGWMQHDKRGGFRFRPDPEPVYGHPRHVALAAAEAAEVVEDELGSLLGAPTPSVKMTLLGLRACLATRSWGPAMAPYVSVVNGSYAEPFPYDRCRDVEELAADASRERLLWVYSASNDEEEGGRLACPQKRLAGKPNAIIVAGSEGDRLFWGSNYGLAYADIAASARDVEGGEGWGTSFASPRVAAVATALAAAFPSLEPEDVRTALLVSSRETPDLRGKVRSGGVLDPRAAARLAKELDELRAGMPRAQRLSWADVERAAVRVGIPRRRLDFLAQRTIVQ